jgi:RHH-type transcriptional regulator, proline utilization regulon repressor / proline dehydrogenase / delta 1-pyrroline-5-carboxylate dehydrogenase
VVPPWNFPIAIPCGGMAAALAAGNTVILKPASDAVLIAWELCQCFWRAGISKSTLQFVPCRGSGPGARLVSHPEVDAVILTGGTDTALRMLAKKPHLRLFAETGGKNATIVTSLSDRELAVKHIVHSAFSHGGQKCSATSLLLLEREIYDDPDFKRMLSDAVRSMIVGSAWHLPSRMGPLIHPPAGDLETALKTLEPEESWAVMPLQIGDNPHLWSPGVKWGVTRGSFTHRTEFFGPMLAVLPFDALEEAIAIVNETGYGLTSGIHSLDEREIALWKSRIQAGNLYINRGTVGAIVLRQPFGGMGKSCFGPGMKAGGPNYLAQFMKFVTEGQIDEASASYDREWREEFSREHDHFRLLGQDNLRRYLPFQSVRVRVSPADSAFDILARLAAARVTGASVIVSAPPEWKDRIPELPPATELICETDAELVKQITAMPAHATERIRYAAPDRVPEEVRLAATQAGLYLADEPVLAEGRIELLWYLREQSISHDYHRYGNLGTRAGEKRAGPK